MKLNKFKLALAAFLGVAISVTQLHAVKIGILLISKRNYGDFENFLEGCRNDGS